MTSTFWMMGRVVLRIAELLCNYLLCTQGVTGFQRGQCWLQFSKRLTVVKGCAISGGMAKNIENQGKHSRSWLDKEPCFLPAPQCGVRAAAGEDERQTPPPREEHHPQDLRRDGAAARRQDGADLRGHRGEVDLPTAGRVLQQGG